MAAGANLAARAVCPPTHGEEGGVAYAYQATERVLKWSVKRAFRRARTRAVVNGATTYKGATHAAQSLNAIRINPTEIRRPSRQAYRPPRISRDRIRILSFNKVLPQCRLARAHGMVVCCRRPLGHRHVPGNTLDAQRRRQFHVGTLVCTAQPCQLW